MPRIGSFGLSKRMKYRLKFNNVIWALYVRCKTQQWRQRPWPGTSETITTHIDQKLKVGLSVPGSLSLWVSGISGISGSVWSVGSVGSLGPLGPLGSLGLWVCGVCGSLGLWVSGSLGPLGPLGSLGLWGLWVFGPRSLGLWVSGSLGLW